MLEITRDRVRALVKMAEDGARDIGGREFVKAMME